MTALYENLNFYLKSLDVETLKQHLIDNKHPQYELDGALKWTCFSGNAQLVDLLVEKGANPNSCDRSGTTVLHNAARGRKEDVIVALLRHGAAFDRWWLEGESLLHWACHNGFLAVISLLLNDFQQNFNDIIDDGRQLLHLACFYGQEHVVDYLLGCEIVNIDQADENGWTPLHYACNDSGEGHIYITRLLLKNKADPMILTPNGETALDLAYGCGQVDIFIEELNMHKMMHLLIFVDSVIPSRDACTTEAPPSRLNRNIYRKISFKAEENTENLRSGRRNREGVIFGIWRKILQNDDIDLLQTFKDSDFWRGDESEPFEKAQRITTEDMIELFNDCYENGLAVYSYIKLNFQTEITDGDFKGILEWLTRLNGFDSDEFEGCNIFETPYTSLTFLALICGRFRVVDSLLRMRQFDILPMGLLVSLIARNLQNEQSFPQQVQEALMVFSDATESLLVDTLNLIFLKDDSVSKHVSLDTLNVPLKSYAKLSLIDLADKAKCTSFLCLPCCQAVLDERWYGKLSTMTTSWRWSTTLMPILLFVFMTINKFPNVHKPRRKRSVFAPLPYASQNLVFRYASQFREFSLLKRILYISHVFLSPSVKFFYHSLFHFIFLLVFAYVVVYNLRFSFSIVELVCISYVVGYGVEEFRQFIHVSLKSSPGSYFIDFRNWLDITAILITMVGFIIRCFCLSNNRVLSRIEAHDTVLFTSRIILLTGLLFFSVRIIFILSIFQILGPKLKMMGDMLKKDLLPLLSIFAIFLVAFGVVFQGLLYPNGYGFGSEEKLTPIETVMSLFQRAFYGMFSTEYTTNELDCSSVSCNNDTGKNLVLYFYNVIYVLIVNIMLVNLLIALFSNTVSRISQESQAHWLADRYKMVEEYKKRSILPPPLNIISVIIECLAFFRFCCIRFCCVKIRRVFSRKNKIYKSVTFIKFLIIQSFALKNRRHLLGTNSAVSLTSVERLSSYGVGQLESKLFQLEEIITKMPSEIIKLIESQQATPDRRQNSANKSIRKFTHRMNTGSNKRTTLQPQTTDFLEETEAEETF